MAGDGAHPSAGAKGKSIDMASGSGIGIDLVNGTSSKGNTASHRSTAMTDNPEVVCEDGRRVKLSGPIEYVWSHGTKYKVVGFSCGYCGRNNSGGGATRFREHLAGVSGSVVACENVPLVIKKLMLDQVSKLRIRSKKNTKFRLFVEKEIMQANSRGYVMNDARTPLDEEAQVQMAVRNSLIDVGSVAADGHRIGSGSGGASCSGSHQATLHKFYQSPESISKAPFDIDLARSKAQVQPRVDVMLTVGAKEKLGRAWAKWFHANDIPGRKADCAYFRSALKLSQQLGEGVHIPRGKEIDGPLLDMNYEEMEQHMAAFKAEWDDFGVTIMCDFDVCLELWTDSIYVVADVGTLN